MNIQQVIPPRSSANGVGRKRETGTRLDNKSQIGKMSSSRQTIADVSTGNKGGAYESRPSCERLVYLATCLIGHSVEVQVIDGSFFSGIFHSTNAEKDFGIILKMARLTKAGTSLGQKNISDSVRKPPSKTLIIPARELVQIIAKDVSVTSDGATNELQREKHQEILIDSRISQSHHVEVERELKPWVPDEDNPECPELENIFDGQWNRGWNQFEVNETLFGVKSTFDEALYTTKLDRGAQTRELEREALRIAREIEGEDTKDLHLAEERGINLPENFEIDEESRFSSVYRRVDDSGYDETEDLLDSLNSETFGDVSDSIISKSFSDLTSGKRDDRTQVSSSSSSMNEVQTTQSSTGRKLYQSGSKSVSALDGESSIQENQLNEQHDASNYTKEDIEKPKLTEAVETSKTVDSHGPKKESSGKGGLSSNATSYAPSRVSSMDQENTSSPTILSERPLTVPVKTQGTTQSVTSRAQSGNSTSSASDCGNGTSASTAPGLSPSSSMGSVSSEKSTLNPHAKEFRFNPHAKSFTPSQTPLRLASPVSDGSFYYSTNVSAVQHIHGMPGIGIGPPFAAHQPVIFNPQVAHMQSTQPYFHSNAPQYGQQMIPGQPRQVQYTQTYPYEQYRGMDF